MVRADDIPIVHTPEGGWQGDMPPPVLAGCTESLAGDAIDMRGVWKACAVEVDGEPAGDIDHVERIEQCGNRIVITSAGVIHDMRTDGTLANGVHDISGLNWQPIHVAAAWGAGRRHVLRPNGGDIAVTRELDGDVLICTVIPLKRVVRMRRIQGIRRRV